MSASMPLAPGKSQREDSEVVKPFQKPRGLICTCLSSGAIHIEVLETMDTNLFICALGWFFTIRGSVTKLIHVCDHSSSFVGGKSQLEQALSEIDQTQV